MVGSSSHDPMVLYGPNKPDDLILSSLPGNTRQENHNNFFTHDSILGSSRTCCVTIITDDGLPNRCQATAMLVGIGTCGRVIQLKFKPRSGLPQFCHNFASKVAETTARHWTGSCGFCRSPSNSYGFCRSSSSSCKSLSKLLPRDQQFC